jgi:signal transduction histidine kinase
MNTVATIIREHHDEIIRLWREETTRAASARGLSQPELENFMPLFLAELAAAEADLGLLTGRRRDLLEKHISNRLRLGFELAEILDEFRLMGVAVSRIWEKDVERPPAEDIQRLFTELDTAATVVADIFRIHMAEDEQREKRYTRLLQEIANQAFLTDAPPFKERLCEVVRLIMEAMSAQAAAILFFEPDGKTLITAASAGAASGVLEKYVTTPDPASFAGQVAGHEEPMTIFDVQTTQLKVDEHLKQNGIHALLGVRFPARYKLTGVLYIGLSVARQFSARELRLIETLADRLTLHLDNARLFNDLNEKVDALTAERELREQFMAILAHDLRGPLTVAKMASAVLAQRPEKLDERRDLAAKIDTNIDRVEKMIRDLLDTERIRAHQLLPLRPAETDLVPMAYALIEELRGPHGDRFVLQTENDVRGVWDVEQLHRALWNLAINGVKYGATDQKITIRLKRTPAGVDISVHNEGVPIPVEDQARIFTSFARVGNPQSRGKSGWGLGLTLVRGAAEAHGGSVNVDSDAHRGTTFTLHLPFDSRPFANHETDNDESLTKSLK